MNITATFANGKTFELKNSKKEYKFAWYVENEEGDGKNGFSVDRVKAETALKSEAKYRARYGSKIAFSEVIEL